MDNASESRDRQEPPVADGLPADAPPAAAWLTDLAGHTRAERARWRGQEQAWSLARLVTFIAAFVVWYPLGEQWLTALAGTGVAVVLFVLAVRRHGAVRAKRELADGLLTVIAESEPRCAGRLTRVRSGDRPPPPERAEAALEPALADGPTWLLTPQERDDLDLYASPAGLFGLLNRTSTPGGERRLSQLLEQPLLDPSTSAIAKRPSAGSRSTMPPASACWQPASGNAAGTRNSTAWRPPWRSRGQSRPAGGGLGCGVG